MMQTLFERLADCHTSTLEASEVRQDYLRMSVWTGDRRVLKEAEVIPLRSVQLESCSGVPVEADLVRVRVLSTMEVDVVVSAIPSAILAVILR